ncbi:MAG: FAD-binding oxidoreductase [Endomicrobium sp.]|jgi:D-lactate dehydrogenase (cytochrome)|nr:FAD-binding oxidoreductase [Endomicrobium sp.]
MIIKRDRSIICRYFEDNSGVTGSNAEFVAVAENDSDICKFVAEMSKYKMPVTIAGSLTGNTASGLAFGGCVLSLEKFNKIGEIKELDNNNALIVVQAGAKICDIKSKASKFGWMYPPDPTEQNASIGGNISTNASGGRGFKFGSTRDYVVALKVIFSDGSKGYFERGKYFADNDGKIIFDTDIGKKNIVLPKYFLPVVKNAAGYYNRFCADLVDVLIGSEGTLCVIVEAVLKLIPQFKDSFGGIIFFDNFNKLYKFIYKIKCMSKLSKINKNINAINAMSLEYFDFNALSIIKNDFPTIPENIVAGVMFEQDTYDYSDSDFLIEKWIDVIIDSNVCLEKVWFASNLVQQEKFRIFRYKIPEHVSKIIRKNNVPKIGTDFAVPENKLLEIIDFFDEKFKNIDVFKLTFGHIGESHLHTNILASNKNEYNECIRICFDIAQKVIDVGGTVSAEHGIGKLKHFFLKKMLGNEGFFEMSKLKKNFDISGIFGQDNIFPKNYIIS